MTRDITLLEKRIALAVKRLRELRTERDGLRDQLEALRRSPGRTERKRPGRTRAASQSGSGVDSSEIATVLRQAIAELRND
jgi:hypothetical protein